MEDSGGTDAPVLAIDIGGTKMAAALVEPGGRIGAYEHIVTPRPPHVDADGLWRTLLALIDKLPVGRPAGVGVGCGGPMWWPSGEVSPSSMPAWRAFPLRDRLAERFPGVPVRVQGDAVAVTVGEHWRGAGRGRRNVLGMVASNSVDGGLILGGRLIDGASGNAGHIGHVIVDPDGPACECGGRGCLESIASGPALSAWARDQGWTGESGKELAHDAARGHPVATRAMNRAGWALGVAIATATHLCDLDVVAVGGGLSQAGPLLFRPLEDTFRAHARMTFAREVRVVPAALGQMAGLVGAAAFVFAPDRYWTGG